MRLAYGWLLLLLTGCPDGAAPPASPRPDAAAQRAAAVELETRLAEGGDAIHVESPAGESTRPGDAAPRLPELRYYAFDG